MFSKLSKKELKEMYLDYCCSKEECRRCESFVPYAEQFKERYGDLLSLREALDMVLTLFFEEVSRRYLGEDSSQYYTSEL